MLPQADYSCAAEGKGKWQPCSQSAASTLNLSLLPQSHKLCRRVLPYRLVGGKDNIFCLHLGDKNKKPNL